MTGSTKPYERVCTSIRQCYHAFSWLRPGVFLSLAFGKPPPGSLQLYTQHTEFMVIVDSSFKNPSIMGQFLLSYHVPSRTPTEIP
jgi:hypothetical protein